MSYLSKQVAEYKAMTPEQQKESVVKSDKRKSQTELQKLAQKENFALFQLASMKSNCYHLKAVLKQGTTHTDLLVAIRRAERQIKDTQKLRKNTKESI